MSKTYLGIIATSILAVAPTLGIEVSEDALTATLHQLAVIVSALYALYGRYDAGGINAFGIRNEK